MKALLLPAEQGLWLLSLRASSGMKWFHDCSLCDDRTTSPTIWVRDLRAIGKDVTWGEHWTVGFLLSLSSEANGHDSGEMYMMGADREREMSSNSRSGRSVSCSSSSGGCGRYSEK